ncbi:MULTISPECIES: hypothetical protein [unclassified Pseudomonas]|uniref:hypothetical protein n=1 Tax=unclassified Pseudomonas TaxID=196821 RepID=UPI0025ECEFB6|nr:MULTISPECIES: hypothetical protein [unclassified Pseudomonas]
MNKLSVGFAASLLLTMSVVNIASADPRAAKLGNITLVGKNPNDTCSFPLEIGKAFSLKDHGKSRGCKNDNYYYFAITGGKPGTLLVFMDAPNCGYSEPTYRYRIVGDEGETLNMSGSRNLAHDGSNGTYLEDHLETAGSPKTGRLGGKLSCVAAW